MGRADVARQASLDWETQSMIDLTKVGAYVYGDHPSTRFMAAAYRLPGMGVQVWRPLEGEPFPVDLLHFVVGGGVVRAWNAAFERVQWNKLLPRCLRDAPPLPIEQTVCTMTESLHMALPASLDAAARVLVPDVPKDAAGRRIMLRLTKPRNGVLWTPDRDRRRFDELYAYVVRDVEAEMAVAERVRPLPAIELATYHMDQRINDRGIYVDLASVRRLKAVALEEEARLQDRLARQTAYAVRSPKQYAALAAWVSAQGVRCSSVAAEARQELLARPDLPAHVRGVLETVTAASRSSVAKLDALLARTSSDGRLRGQFQALGAGSTRRWAGRGVQLQNIPRGGCPDPALMLKMLADVMGDV